MHMYVFFGYSTTKLLSIRPDQEESFSFVSMSDVDETSDSTAASSAMAAVQAAISSLGHFAPKSDATRIAALKEEAEKLRKLRKENRRLQRNEKRKRSRLLAKGSGWDSADILECFRLKHENALKRQKKTWYNWQC